LYLAFDDDQDSDAFLYLCQKLNVNPASPIEEVDDKIKILLCKFKHGGKKSAQQGAFKLIKSRYPKEFLDDSLLFFIDSDIQLKPDSLWQFVRHMQVYNKTCLTGMITCITSDTQGFLSYYQDIEYISGQIFWRNMEDCFGGATSCLPGAFTVLQWPSFDAVSTMYFSKTEYNDVFEYQRFYLGEDRYLTHLLMEREPHKIGFCDSARCKTEAPDTVLGLLKQRRRWFLGHISNDTWMISSIKLWRTYPILTLFNFLNNSRNTSIYIYLLYFVLFLNKNVSFLSWFVYIILPITLNWLFITYYALKLQRKMNILFYFIIVLFQPIFSMMFMYYTIYNIRTQTWGGVRIDRESEKSTVIQITESISADSSST
jgi:chitin synthase